MEGLNYRENPEKEKKGEKNRHQNLRNIMGKCTKTAPDFDGRFTGRRGFSDPNYREEGK